MFFSFSNSISKRIYPPRYFEQEIAALFLRKSNNQHCDLVEANDVSLLAIYQDRHRLSRILAREIVRGTYQFGAATIRMVSIEGRNRELFTFALMDRIIHGAVARSLTEVVNPRLSDLLHSYRRGKGWYDALGQFAAYTRAHRKSVREPRQRGLYVLRRDISQYTDRIPVGDRAPVWKLLANILSAYDPKGIKDSHWRIIQQIIRPEIISKAGHCFQRLRGIPTGSPITAILYNLCAAPLDEALGQIEGAFYARYCDDFIFAHPRAAVTQGAEKLVSATLSNLGLEANEAKGGTFYFNGAGRASEEWPEAKGSQYISFLGCGIGFDGTVSLRALRARRFLREMRSRIERIVALSAYDSPEQVGPLVCRTVNRSLIPNSPFRQKYAAILRHAVTDRGHLRELDYWIALSIAEAISGVRGPRAFRVVPYRTMRQIWKLKSLCHVRNLSCSS